MRIGPPLIRHYKGRHYLSAKIVVETAGVDCPKSLWFAATGDEPPFLPDMTDAFVVGLIASAMYLGEDIWVEGKVSTRLANGLDTYQNVLSTWWPGIFKCVDIHYECLLERRKDLRPGGVGCTFSGGLDSYHAVLQLLPKQVKYPGFSITHALMINGFEQISDLDRRGIAQHMYSIYQSTLKEWDVNLLMVDTNMRSFRSVILERMEQVNSYSSALASCAHALGGVFGRFGISGHATYAYNQLEPDGSHPALDHHLSSDQLQIFHTGTTHSRSRKTEILAEFPHVRESLRVCFRGLSFDKQTRMPINCCECEKCVRTMVALIIIGKLDQFPTFSKRRAPLTSYRNPDILRAIDDQFLEDLMELARRYAKDDWVEILDAARVKHRAMEGEAQKSAVTAAS